MWPSWLQVTISPLATMSVLDPEIGGLSCVAGSSDRAWYGTLSMPALVCVIAGSTYVVLAVSSVCRGHISRAKILPEIRRRYPFHLRLWLLPFSPTNGVLAILSITYPLVVRKSLDGLVCIDVLGTSVLRSDTSVICGSGLYQRRKLMAIAAGILYGVGIPLAFLAVLWFNRYGLSCMTA